MIAMDWTALVLGAAAGTLISMIFFAGLAYGMKHALQGENTVTTLALSALIRIALFLGVGWIVVTLAGPWAFAGYGIAFFVCRRVATTMARIPAQVGGAK